MNDSNNHWEDLFQQLPFEPTVRAEHRQQLKTDALDALDAFDAFDDSQQHPGSQTKRLGQTLMKYKIPQLTVGIVVACWWSSLRTSTLVERHSPLKTSSPSL